MKRRNSKLQCSKPVATTFVPCDIVNHAISKMSKLMGDRKLRIGAHESVDEVTFCPVTQCTDIWADFTVASVHTCQSPRVQCETGASVVPANLLACSAVPVEVIKPEETQQCRAQPYVPNHFFPTAAMRVRVASLVSTVRKSALFGEACELAIDEAYERVAVRPSCIGCHGTEWMPVDVAIERPVVTPNSSNGSAVVRSSGLLNACEIASEFGESSVAIGIGEFFSRCTKSSRDMCCRNAVCISVSTGTNFVFTSYAISGCNQHPTT